MNNCFEYITNSNYPPPPLFDTERSLYLNVKYRCVECVSCEVIRNQEEIIKGQVQTILHLQSHITARLGLNSGNSSFPPSRDTFSPLKTGGHHFGVARGIYMKGNF